MNAYLQFYHKMLAIYAQFETRAENLRSGGLEVDKVPKTHEACVAVVFRFPGLANLLGAYSLAMRDAIPGGAMAYPPQNIQLTVVTTQPRPNFVFGEEDQQAVDLMAQVVQNRIMLKGLTGKVMFGPVLFSQNTFLAPGFPDFNHWLLSQRICESLPEHYIRAWGCQLTCLRSTTSQGPEGLTKLYDLMDQSMFLGAASPSSIDIVTNPVSQDGQSFECVVHKSFDL